MGLERVTKMKFDFSHGANSNFEFCSAVHVRQDWWRTEGCGTGIGIDTPRTNSQLTICTKNHEVGKSISGGARIEKEAPTSKEKKSSVCASFAPTAEYVTNLKRASASGEDPSSSFGTAESGQGRKIAVGLGIPNWPPLENARFDGGGLWRARSEIRKALPPLDTYERRGKPMACLCASSSCDPLRRRGVLRDRSLN